METVNPPGTSVDNNPIKLAALVKTGEDAGTAAIRELPEKAKGRLFDYSKVLSRLFPISSGPVSKPQLERKLAITDDLERLRLQLEDIVGGHTAKTLGVYHTWWAMRYTEVVFFNASDCDCEVGDARQKANDYFKGKIHNLARSDVKALVQDFTMKMVRDNGHEVAIALFKKARDGDVRSMEHFLRVFYPELSKPDVNMVGVSVGFDPTKLPTAELEAQVLQLRKAVGELPLEAKEDQGE